jgi:hypothetical protein
MKAKIDTTLKPVAVKTLKVGDRFRTGPGMFHAEFQVVWKSAAKRGRRAAHGKQAGSFVYLYELVVKGPWGTETMHVSDRVWLTTT